MKFYVPSGSDIVEPGTWRVRPRPWFEFADQDFIKKSETKSKTESSKFETETRDFKISVFLNFSKIFQKMLPPLRS